MESGNYQNYVVEGLIGRGGMAEVFRARAIRGPFTGQTVAIKRLLPAMAANEQFVELFIAEAEVSRRLSHPAIVKVLETGVMNDTYYIAMEFIDGHDLSQILRQCAVRSLQLPVDFGCYVAHRVAEALDYAHQVTAQDGSPMGIVHCDVTPANIFISRMGQVHLGDFGVAQTAVRGLQLDANLFAGKAQYLAPEQIRCEDVAPCTDVFALGAVLYELLTSEQAFNSSDGDHERLWQQIIEGDVLAPSALRPAIPAQLDELVLQALAPQRKADSGGRWRRWMRGLAGGQRQRFASAGEFAQALVPLYDPHIGNALAIASVVRGLFPQPVS